jgi:hypothetical protein
VRLNGTGRIKYDGPHHLTRRLYEPRPRTKIQHHLTDYTLSQGTIGISISKVLAIDEVVIRQLRFTRLSYIHHMIATLVGKVVDLLNIAQHLLEINLKVLE